MVVHIIDAVLLPLELTAAAPIPAPAAAPVAEEAGEPAEPTPTPVETYRTYTSVVDALTGEGLDLLAAVDAADLEGAFGPSFNGTVFAPSNAVSCRAVPATGAAGLLVRPGKGAELRGVDTCRPAEPLKPCSPLRP